MIPILREHNLGAAPVGKLYLDDSGTVTVELTDGKYICVEDIREFFGNIGFTYKDENTKMIKDEYCVNKFQIIEWSLDPAILL
jgi:hypothetical protein